MMMMMMMMMMMIPGYDDDDDDDDDDVGWLAVQHPTSYNKKQPAGSEKMLAATIEILM